MSGTETAETSIVDRLRRRVMQTLGSLHLRGRRIALLDFPNYSNVGDSAIWLGERAAFRELGADVVYACHQDSYSRDRLKRLLGDGCICMSGGGNLGDLYPNHQEFRERVLADFPDNRIIQLPQSICFLDSVALERTGEALRRHPQLTLLVRDHPSFEVAHNALGVSPILCPDMAFALGSLPRQHVPDVDVTGLCRRDFESSRLLDRLGDHEIPVADWREADGSLVLSVVRGLEWMEGNAPGLFGWVNAASALTFDSTARDRLGRGMRLLERGRVVITDRLHGHVLCMLASIPHVLLDSRYGKVHAFHEAWTADSPLVKTADSVETAARLARDLAGLRESSAA